MANEDERPSGKDIEASDRLILETFFSAHGINLLQLEWHENELRGEGILLDFEDGQVVSIEISRKIPLQGCELLFGLPQLRRLVLDFQGGKMIRSEVEVRCRHLEEIRVGFGVECGNLSFLPLLKNLRRLILHGKVGEFKLEGFEGLKGLVLSRVDEFMVEDISKAFPNLEQFIWKNTKVEIGIPNGLDRLEKFKVVDIVGGGMTLREFNTNGLKSSLHGL